MVVLRPETPFQKVMTEQRCVRQGRRPCRQSHPLETQRLEGAVRSKALSSRRKNQEVRSLQRDREGGPPKQSHLGGKSHAVINASTVTRRDFRFASEEKMRAMTTCPYSARNTSAKEKISRETCQELRTKKKERENASVNCRIQWSFCSIKYHISLLHRLTVEFQLRSLSTMGNISEQTLRST